MTQNINHPRQKLAKDCTNMDEVRYEVDRIDYFLIQALAERQGYISAAAKIKKGRNQIRDEPRINMVIKNITEQANQQGLSLEIALPIWRLLLEKSIAHEFIIWDELNTEDTV